MKRTLTTLLSLMLALALLAGCGGSTSATPKPEATPTAAPTPEVTPPEEPKPVELYLSAAASLTDVITEIAEAYKGKAPHVTLIPSFDSSGALQTQIEEGAPADLFISAAQKQMNALEEQGLIDGATRVDLLVNKVVLIVPAGSELGLGSFEDVAGDRVSMVAVGDETVPVGQYTQEIYEFLGSWEQVRAKANLGANVRAVLAWVETGDVDCGIVYATDAAASGDLVEIVAEAPEGSHQPVIYPAAVLAETEHPEEAQAFLDFLKSAEAVRLFEAAGFTMA